jgi:type II restriction/modification system DNA methylase subunit YeeA
MTASSNTTPTIKSSYTAWIIQNRQTIAEMKRLEEENNRLFIDAYGLQDELTPEVPIEQITLTVNPAYRYGKKLTDDDWSVAHGFGEELETRFREDTLQELVSYAIGCMMGRYSLDAPGLIYAHSGNLGFDPSRYTRFPADADGILPITDTDWFDEDAAHRLVEFIAVAWDQTHLEENLSFLAANLSPKNGESSRETLRRYLSDRFFKDHLQTYKNRPIYWCFSSGKQKAFQCLVYLHRYHSGTLARMRMEYVVPLQSKMAARIDSLADDIQAASSSAQTKRLQKERDKLTKQLEELRRFDEQLRHHADQRIALDLDDGVKVNYGKFGDLLAEVKTVTGQKSD